MGAALNLALDQLTQQKQAYKQAGLEYYRPWLFVLTDGEPTDGQVFTTAAARVRETEQARGVSVFAIGVGSGSNLSRLAELSTRRSPVKLDGLSFSEFFAWLSASLMRVGIDAFGSSDAGVAQAETGEQIPLPPATGWATA